jgi:hypothetical protein
LDSKDHDKFDEGTELLDTVRKDPDENYNLLDKSLIKSLTVWYIKAFCKNSQTKKPTVKDFIKTFEKELKSLKEVENLEDEIKLLEMARRYNECYGEKTLSSGKQKSEGDEESSKKEADEPIRCLTLADVEMIVEKKAPFTIEKKLID